MVRPILLPELGGGPVVLSAWFATVGERVYEGDRLIEVLLDGATFDVAAPTTGRLVEKFAHPDDRVTAGQQLGVVEEE
ncbi:MAG: biotin attachment protein [Gemmataceae bacterium]|nr:biotin attachment protein [Gemmataceae bacterium]